MVNTATFKLLTDALVVFHFAFVAFVMIGGLLALRWNRLAWVHIPCVFWVIWIETSGNLCPLTPLENSLREKAGLTTYEGGFVDHYIIPLLYPEDLTRNMQLGIAAGLVVVNLVSYGLIVLLRRRRRRKQCLAAASPGAAAADPAISAEAGSPVASVERR